ncbi:MAG: aconitate hydratase, mitochondrial precursor [Acidimicrobiaceae bacterium]|nr:MAG: aconitate hydratase, mitochondrial precursor [Acidimicrobiaceae bacterium]
MTSFGEDQPLRVPVSLTPMTLGQRTLKGKPVITSTASGATNSDGHHAETAGVGRVAVGADHHAARERVVLEDDLVDDAAARPPEPDSVLGAHRAEEVVHLAVDVDGDAEIDACPDLCRDEVVAVHRGRHRSGRQAGGHELQQSHLRRRVLHRDPVGMEVVVRPTALDRACRVGEVVEEDLLGEGERTTEPLASGGNASIECGVGTVYEAAWRSCGDGHREILHDCGAVGSGNNWYLHCGQM